MLLQLLLGTFAAAKGLELEFAKVDYGGPHPRSRELGLPAANDLMHQVCFIPRDLLNHIEWRCTQCHYMKAHSDTVQCHSDISST
jgi:hypothetical protein